MTQSTSILELSHEKQMVGYTLIRAVILMPCLANI